MHWELNPVDYAVKGITTPKTAQTMGILITLSFPVCRS